MSPREGGVSAPLGSHRRTAQLCLTETRTGAAGARQETRQGCRGRPRWKDPMQPPSLGRVLPKGWWERTYLGPQVCTHSLTAVAAWRGAGDPTGSLDKGNEGSGEPRPRAHPHMPAELPTEGSVPVTLAGPSSRHGTLASPWPPQVPRRAQAWGSHSRAGAPALQHPRRGHCSLVARAGAAPRGCLLLCAWPHHTPRLSGSGQPDSRLPVDAAVPSPPYRAPYHHHVRKHARTRPASPQSEHTREGPGPGLQTSTGSRRPVALPSSSSWTGRGWAGTGSGKKAFET